MLAILIRLYRLNPFRPACGCGPVSCSARGLQAATTYGSRIALPYALHLVRECDPPEKGFNL